MAFLRGSGGAGRSADARGLLHEAARAQATGAIEVVDAGTAAIGRIWLYEGRVYAATIEGSPARVAERLASAGTLDAEQVAHLKGGDIGAEAVDRGWLDVEALGTTHQEFMLATAGALLSAPNASAHRIDDVVTSTTCCVPVDVDAVLETITIRADRLAAGWLQINEALADAVVGLTIDSPTTLVVAPTGAAVPAALAIAELRAFLAACDGVRTLDEVAGACGFTRAEAVHLARALAVQGLIGPVEVRALAASCDQLDVPEQFPRVIRESVSLAEPVAEVVVVETDVASDADEETDVSADIEPPVTKPDATDGPETGGPAPSDSASAGAFRVAALEAELASAERWVAELRNRLAVARSAESSEVQES